MTDTPAPLPLSGLRIVSVEQAIAVPLATRHLSDLGAEVIKIERPEGDFARRYDSLAGGVSVHFAWTNRGKKSVVLDLKSEAGREAAFALVRTADVFVCNMGPGVMQRLGLGWEPVHRAAPRAIYCELSGYGRGGPLESRKAYDLLIQNETGAAAVSGTASEPAKIGVSIVDISGAMYVLSSILAAIVERGQAGEGRRLSINLFDSMAEWMSVPLLQAKYSGKFLRSGRYHNAIFPYGPFRCADGEVVLAVQNDGEWRKLCEGVLGSSALLEDPRFATSEGRHVHRDEIQPILDDRFASLTTADAVRLLEEADVPFAECRTVEEVVSHPELMTRNRWRTFAAEQGAIELLRSPYDQEGTWPTPMGQVPGLGEHTAEVLNSLPR